MRMFRTCGYCHHQMIIKEYFERNICENCGHEYSIFAVWGNEHNLQYRYTASNRTNFSTKISEE